MYGTSVSSSKIFLCHQPFSITSPRPHKAHNYLQVCGTKTDFTQCISTIINAKNELARSKYFVQNSWKNCFFKKLINSTIFAMMRTKHHRKHLATAWTDKYSVNGSENVKKWSIEKYAKCARKQTNCFFKLLLFLPQSKFCHISMFVGQKYPNIVWCPYVE